MTTVYAIILAVALLMVCLYFYLDRKRNKWLMLLFISIAICDCGYFLLATSRTLDGALWANRLAYLGSVFLPFSMLMMVMKLSRFRYPKVIPQVLTGLNTVMFLIAASGGILPIYYKEVSLGFSDGAAHLIKEYGPLHDLYKVFLLGYFAAMIAVIIYTAVKKTVVSTKHSVFLAFVVVGNIATWLVENMIGAGFEFLSISYILSEGLILFLYGILEDYGLSEEQSHSASEVTAPEEEAESIPAAEEIKAFSKEQIESIFKNWKTIGTLSQREKEVLTFILENKKRKIIAETLFVTESTIKKHTSAIFKKLEIANRTELFEKCKEFI